jgi:hypothetical protein
VVLAFVEPQHSHAPAVIDRCVLEPFAPAASYDLDVDLDRITRAVLFKELQLFRSAPACFDQVGYADVAEHPLNSLRLDPHLVHALQPDARATRTERMFEARAWVISATTSSPIRRRRRAGY